MKVYAFSGLGADERVFQYLDIGVELIPIPWIEPQSNESITSYSKRISSFIDTSTEFALLGVSFGGLIALEVSKFLPTKTTILISSFEHTSDLHPVLKFFGRSGIVNLLPTWAFKPPRLIAIYLFGAKNKELLSAILKDTDPAFAQWAIKSIFKWVPENNDGEVHRIHGELDRLIFPPLKGAEILKGGTHFMIVDQAKELSRVIRSIIDKKESATIS